MAKVGHSKKRGCISFQDPERKGHMERSNDLWLRNAASLRQPHKNMALEANKFTCLFFDQIQQKPEDSDVH